jgi:formylglycine-generating enzyme required for sulfatase activity
MVLATPNDTGSVTITGNSVYYYDSSGDSPKGAFIEGREVTLSPFYIAKYETTYELWYTVRQWAIGNGYTFANAGSEGHDGTVGEAPTPTAKYEPVTGITWRDTVVWCNAYSEMSGKEPVYRNGSNAVLRNSTAAVEALVDSTKWVGKDGYRLPTEAEWEYAARGGGTPSTTGPFTYKWAGTSTNLGNYAWYYANSDNATHPVGVKMANSLGLYDMTGNVCEYCWDRYDIVATGTVTDPAGPGSGTEWVNRGGCWKDFLVGCAVTFRFGNLPDSGYYGLGFRLAAHP